MSIDSLYEPATFDISRVDDGSDRLVAPPSAVTQVVFIDSRTPDIQDLLAGLQPGVIAHVLDASSDGLQQMADFLAANHLTGLAAIDIVGHGQAGEIILGASAVTDGSLGSHASELAAIGAALAPGGDLALYACNTAAGSAGHQFIADLSAYAGGADVAASTHLIGGAAEGGDFSLDAFAGPGVSSAPGPFTASAISGFDGLLTPSPSKAEVIVVGTGGGANSTLVFADDDNSGAATNTETFFSPGSNVPANVDNNLMLVAVDPLHNKYFLVVTNLGEQEILEGTLNPDLASPGSAHTLTAIYTDNVQHQITGIALDPITQKVYFTEYNQFRSIDYTGANSTVLETGTANQFLNGLTIDVSTHTAYLFSTTHHLTTVSPSLPGSHLTSVFTNALYKDANYTVAGTGLTSMTLKTSGGGALPGLIESIAVTPDHNHLLIGTQVTTGSDSGVFEYTVGGDGSVTTIWSQKTASGSPTGDVKGVAVDVNGDYYVTVADSTDDGVYGGKITDSNKSPTLLQSMPTGGVGLEPTGLTVDVPPSLTGIVGNTTHAVEGGSSISAITATPTVTDPDATLGEITSATVVITDGHTGDVLAASTAGTSITASYNASTKTLTLSGADTFAHYQQVLASVTYQDGATDLTPDGTNPTRHVDFTVNDGLADSQTSEIILTLNRRPTATNESAKVGESLTTSGTAGTGGTGALAGDHDLDGTALTISAVTGGTVGTKLTGTYGDFTVNADGSYSYAANDTSAIDTATKGSHPTDVFTLTVTNGEGLNATPNPTFTFIIDRAPTVVTETAAVLEAATVTGTSGTGGTGALAGDSDPDGDPLTISAFSSVAGGSGVLGSALAGDYGSLTLNADGSFSYTASNTAAIDAATTGSHPVDVFTVVVSDGQGLTTTTTLSINLDRAPTTVDDSNAAVQQAVAVTGNVLANDSDKDGDTLTVSALAGGTVGTLLHGTYGDLTLNADGSYSYSAGATGTELTALAGAAGGSEPVDSFTYTASDGHGGTTTAKLDITVDRLPTVVADTNTAVQGGGASTGNVLTNDSDKDGQSLAVSQISNTTSGTGVVGSAIAGVYGDLTLNADGTYSYQIGATKTEQDALTAAGGGHQTDVFTYQASDGVGGLSTTTLTITTDRLPVTAPFGVTVVEGATGSQAAAGVLTGDTDADGDTLTVTAIAGGTVGSKLTGTYGDFTVNADGSYSYAANNTAAIDTAATGSRPSETFTITVSDGQGGSTTEVVTATVDRPTVVTDDSYTAFKNQALTVASGTGVLANDSDADHDSFTAVLKTGPTHAASFTLNADGSFDYTPAANYVGTDTFTYVANDGAGDSTVATVTIDVKNALPIPAPDTASDVAQQTVTANAATGLLANDTDPNSETLTVTGIKDVSSGTGTVGTALAGVYGDLTVQADGSYSYTAGVTKAEQDALAAASTGSHPTDVFTYTVQNTDGFSATSTLTVTLDRLPTPANDTAAAVDGAAATTGNVITNDTDPDGDALTVTALTGGTVGTLLHGTYGDLTLNADGTYSYAAGATGAEQTALAAATTGSHATESFTYTVSDGQGGTAQATLTVTLDRLPTTVADTNTAVQQGPAATGNVLTNDSDKDGDTLTVSAVTGGTVGTLFHGTYGDVTLNADGSYSYAAGATGAELAALAGAGSGSHLTEVVTYTASDGHGGTATNTLTITIDRLPTLTADTGSAVQQGSAATGNVLTNDSDQDGDSLTVTAVTGGTVGTSFHGTYGDLTLNADGSYSYSAGATAAELTALAGAASGSHLTEAFTYTASDGHGGTAQTTLTFTLDRLPTAANDANTAVQAGPAATGNVLTNDSDLDGDSLTVSAVAGGTVGTLFHGTYGDLTLNADGTYSYSAGATGAELTALAAAAAGSHVTEAFTYTESDGHGGTAQATLTLTLDRLPTLVADTNTSGVGFPASGNVLTNDSDKDADTLTVTAIAGGSLGTTLHGTYGDIVLNADGSYSYTAGVTGAELAAIAAVPVGSAGVDVFTYTASDGHGGSGSTTLSITLNRPPDAVDDANAAVQSGPAATGNVLGNDTDPDNDTLTVSAIAGGTVGALMHGTYGDLTLGANGAYTYTPTATGGELTALLAAPAGSHATDAFTYTASDGKGGTDQAVLTITLDRLPILTADTNSAVQQAPAATGNVLANDSDKDGDTLTVSAVTGGTVGTLFHGTYGDLTLNANGTYSYAAGATAAELTALAAAPAGSHPVETFTYTASDGHGGTATSTLSFNLDRLPTTVPEGAELLMLTGVSRTAGTAGTGALHGDSDKDGDPLTITALSGGTLGSAAAGTYGTLTLNANGSYSYTANNLAAILLAPIGSHPVDVFTYTISDGHGGTVNQTLSFTIDRLPIIDGLHANQTTDDKHTIMPFATATITEPDAPSHFDTFKVVLDDAAKGTFTAASLAASGFTANGFHPGEYDYYGTAAQATTALHQLVFAPTENRVAPGLSETTTFTLTVINAIAPPVVDSTTTVTALSINDAPTSGPVTATVEENHLQLGNVITSGVTDPDKADSVHLSGIVAGAGSPAALGPFGALLFGAHGVLAIEQSGAYIYLAFDDHLAPGHTESDTFTYQATDSHGASSQGTLTFTITSDDGHGGGIVCGPSWYGSTGGGHDLVGNAGPTSFIYQNVNQSPAATPDVIENFNPGEGDVIDLRNLDAIPTTWSHDHFSLVGAFSNHAGQLVLQSPDNTGYWHLMGDVNGDGVADFVVAFHLVGAMNTSHILL
ncbi:MAG TPA: Ig-like domain-containing protein [Caulobacteraceae bacterium]|nr:Ig-like domain-containing protein [Caulobacteraceae bacterium]